MKFSFRKREKISNKFTPLLFGTTKEQKKLHDKNSVEDSQLDSK